MTYPPNETPQPHGPAAEAGRRRWLRPLALEAGLAAAFVTIAFAAHDGYFLIPALFFGPSFAGVLTVIYLATTSAPTRAACPHALRRPRSRSGTSA